MDTANRFSDPSDNEDSRLERQEAERQVKSILRTLTHESQELQVSLYLDEVCRCCRVGAWHAASLALWCALSHHLRAQMAWIGLNVIDAELRRYKSGRYLEEYRLRNETDIYQVGKFNEEIAVVTAQNLGLIDGGVAGALQQFRGQRNNVAHQIWPSIGAEHINNLLSQSKVVDLLRCVPERARVSRETILNRLKCPGYEDEEFELKQLVKRVRESERLQLARTLYERYLFGEGPMSELMSDSLADPEEETDGDKEPHQMPPADDEIYFDRVLALWRGIKYTLPRRDLANLMKDLAQTLERQRKLEAKPQLETETRPIKNPVTPLILWRFLHQDSEELAPTEIKTLLSWVTEEVSSTRVEELDVQSKEALIGLIRCVPDEPGEESMDEVVCLVVRCWCESERGWYAEGKDGLADAIVSRGRTQLLDCLKAIIQERVREHRPGEREQDLLDLIESIKPAY